MAPGNWYPYAISHFPKCDSLSLSNCYRWVFVVYGRRLDDRLGNSSFSVEIHILSIQLKQKLQYCYRSRKVFALTSARGRMARSETIDEKGDTKINEEIVVDAGRPKSKKELRLERKAKRKSIEASSATELEEKSNCDCYGMLGKEEYVRLKRLRRAKERKEQEKLTRKKLLEEKKTEEAEKAEPRAQREGRSEE